MNSRAADAYELIQPCRQLPIGRQNKGPRERSSRRPPDGGQFATFGSWPVEIRETQKRGGFTISAPGDEVRKFGLNTATRARLLRAAASLIVPDHSQLPSLLKVMQIS